MRAAIASAIVSAPVTKLDQKSLTLEFDVKVSAACWKFFDDNGHTFLYLSGWTIKEFDLNSNKATISMVITGTYELNYR